MTTIHLLKRDTRQEVEEDPPAKGILIWLYKDNLISKVARFLLANVPILGWVYASFQKSPLSKKTIHPFIQKYGVAVEEFLHPPESFKNFSEFFERALKPEVRPIQNFENILVSPADGRVKEVNRDHFEVKGRQFSIEKLIKDPLLVEKFKEGKILTIRLAPQDYHRLHAPLAGKVLSVRKLNGPLFSVSPLAIRKNMAILHENKRVLVEFENFAMVLVGATFVGTIHLDVAEGDFVEKGQQIAKFSFGGSMCVLLLKKNFKLDEDLYYPKGEVLVKMGQSLAQS